MLFPEIWLLGASGGLKKFISSLSLTIFTVPHKLYYNSTTGRASPPNEQESSPPKLQCPKGRNEMRGRGLGVTGMTMMCCSAPRVACLTLRKRRLGLFGHVCATSTYCSCKSDSQNLHQDEGWWAVITGVETCLWSTRHDLGPPDLPQHGCHSDWGT